MTIQLARRMARVQASAIREILKVTERPEVLSFAGGLPAPGQQFLRDEPSLTPC